MKRPNFNEGTEVKVISHDFKEYMREHGVETESDMHGWCGHVTAVRGLDKAHNELEHPYSPDNYPVEWWVDVSIKSPVDGREYVTTFDDWEKQLEPV